MILLNFDMEELEDSFTSEVLASKLKFLLKRPKCVKLFLNNGIEKEKLTENFGVLGEGALLLKLIDDSRIEINSQNNKYLSYIAKPEKPSLELLQGHSLNYFIENEENAAVFSFRKSGLNFYTMLYYEGQSILTKPILKNIDCVKTEDELISFVIKQKLQDFDKELFNSKKVASEFFSEIPQSFEFDDNQNSLLRWDILKLDSYWKSLYKNWAQLSERERISKYDNLIDWLMDINGWVKVSGERDGYEHFRSNLKLEKDTMHGEIEVWSRGGKHLGSFSPIEKFKKPKHRDKNSKDI